MSKETGYAVRIKHGEIIDTVSGINRTGSEQQALAPLFVSAATFTGCKPFFQAVHIHDNLITILDDIDAAYKVAVNFLIACPNSRDFTLEIVEVNR